MIYVTVVSLYVLMLLGISVYKSRSVKTDEDFIVAGRGVPVYMLVATLVCTWIGSGSHFGTAGLTLRTGISELWFSAGAWVGILIVYMIAARVRQIAQYTLTDLLETRSSQLAKVLGTITSIIASMVIAGYQFFGGGRCLAILAVGSLSPETTRSGHRAPLSGRRQHLRPRPPRPLRRPRPCRRRPRPPRRPLRRRRARHPPPSR